MSYYSWAWTSSSSIASASDSIAEAESFVLYWSSWTEFMSRFGPPGVGVITCSSLNGVGVVSIINMFSNYGAYWGCSSSMSTPIFLFCSLSFWLMRLSDLGGRVGTLSWSSS